VELMDARDDPLAVPETQRNLQAEMAGGADSGEGMSYVRIRLRSSLGSRLQNCRYRDW
jgi:hypothetical protein